MSCSTERDSRGFCAILRCSCKVFIFSCTSFSRMLSFSCSFCVISCILSVSVLVSSGSVVSISWDGRTWDIPFISSSPAFSWPILLFSLSFSFILCFLIEVSSSASMSTCSKRIDKVWLSKPITSKILKSSTTSSTYALLIRFWSLTNWLLSI